jgi:ABC-type phosphate transport system permease subunit
MDFATLMHSPHFLLFATAFCFIIGIFACEAMPLAKQKGCLVSYWIAAIASIVFGIAGWVGFFIEILAYVHRGMNP